ncbi:hypothetical protein ATANTOWER_018167 [Ataeniobius toweri]|uniref:Uncharacterized protein n=1 Tax=Ataeniobius toweri TaxID=208326 RepID=A0ABU7CHT8_9TELE|nr:hypothetical protein [Ataeniobius toweri]
MSAFIKLNKLQGGIFSSEKVSLSRSASLSWTEERSEKEQEDSVKRSSSHITVRLSVKVTCLSSDSANLKDLSCILLASLFSVCLFSKLICFQSFQTNLRGLN